MKRLIAKRKLKRKCQCGKHISKGEVYYKHRIVFSDIYGGFDVVAFEDIICFKCKYKADQHNKRFENYKDKCIHPQKFINTVWHYIQGECVKEPSYDQCELCGKILV